ncbi:hypothetical protein [Halorubrum sp. 48-1-W]|uniref:hypothetical protein n=1 Tax=Halorubrum sp. 48-1-W TaxID=2249761 RepID=UPI001F540F17|nr:hypothetical protein [Halorubrum sp. 48-1-W]
MSPQPPCGLDRRRQASARRAGDPDGHRARPYVAVIDEADAARSDLRRAAGFVESVGLDRLVAAVAEADRAGDDDLADRGREALAAYRRYRAAASGADGRPHGSGATAPDRSEAATPDRPGLTLPDRPEAAAPDRPGTPKSDTGQPPTR